VTTVVLQILFCFRLPWSLAQH